MKIMPPTTQNGLRIIQVFEVVLCLGLFAPLPYVIKIAWARSQLSTQHENPHGDLPALSSEFLASAVLALSLIYFLVNAYLIVARNHRTPYRWTLTGLSLTALLLSSYALIVPVRYFSVLEHIMDG